MFVPSLKSARLTLLSLSPEFLRACLDEDFETAGRLVGLNFPLGERIETSTLDRRLKQLDEDETLQLWLLRAVGLRETGAMVGYIGFHDAPGAEYLEHFAPGGLEIGYTVFAPFRGQGYATEACQTLIDWAHHEQGVARFVLSIGPHNLPSLRIAEKLGFEKVGAHMDEEDGEEYVFRCDLTTRLEF